MRIIGGHLGGQVFDSPAGHRTHPMSDKVRAALFNVLGDITDLSVLDAFAGSGAISFEAISRGAANVVAIDNDRTAQQAIVRNLHKLGITSVRLVKSSVNAWSDYHAGEQFDLVICDPPYDHTQLSTLTKLTRHVKTNGLFILSWPGHDAAPDFNNLTIVRQANYGDAQLIFYRQQ